MSLGDQLAQSCHCCFQFSHDHPHLAERWLKESNYICILEIDNEPELVKLWEQAIALDIPASRFIEPDFDDSLTAIALAPGPKSKKLCSQLRLAMKDK